MQTQYEIVNKTTEEVYPVTSMTFNEGSVEVTAIMPETASTPAGEHIIQFDNALKDGNLTNEDWIIREVGTHNQPNGQPAIEETKVNE